MGRGSWITQMGPKCHHKGPYQGEADGGLRTERRTDMNTEAEAGVMWPQAKEHGGLQRLQEARSNSSLEAPGGTGSTHNLILVP